MLRFVKIAVVIAVALLLQVTLLPAYLRDPFQPNILVTIVAWVGLRKQPPLGGVAAFLLGLLQDTFSGLYLGLNGFTYLVMYILLQSIAHRLYTDSRYLMILVVFLATIGNGILQLLLLILFSAAPGIYSAILPPLLPQALVNALVTSVVLTLAARRGAVVQQ
ncbi:rod shape-determining protein MreD [Geomobilimonas luticola]|uniref:Rod shape-determining protein MreD n=1 Tax=Geomobilimonas luticola TaxID=1114878 RepID=A0ABS5SIH1_9BACT|nr:rod shape-determining protein MreD [Geomobilimonas luticola]MBT0653997.1 rod shape-determining protein MreD [Geomobilimonas luticola]